MTRSVIPAAHVCRQAPVEPGYGKVGIQQPIELDARLKHSGLSVQC
jgi:hypothetical protein